LVLSGLILILSIACSDSTTTTPTGNSVSIVAGASALTTGAYSPDQITVPVGTIVMWTNNDTVTHTVVQNAVSFNSGNITPGGSYSMTFTTAGSYPYHCSIHPGMVGLVTVQ